MAEKTVKVGAKRRLIIPKHAVDLLDLSQGSQLSVSVIDGVLQLTPVSVRPEELPAYLRARFKARQERTGKGLSLAEFSAKMNRNAARVDRNKKSASLLNTTVKVTERKATQTTFAVK